MLCQSVSHNFTLQIAELNDTRARASPWLIKASVDTGSLREEAMIEGLEVCVCVLHSILFV